MFKKMFSVAALAGLAGCAASGGYQGAAEEAVYDKNLEAARQVAVINNDDYYEYHMDGRIYVLADKNDVKSLLSTGEIPFRQTRIGAGPKGETVVFAIAGPEKNKKEGFGSVEMFDGRRAGYEKDFYGEVLRDGKYYVFGSWSELSAYKKSGDFKGVASATAGDGKPASFSSNAPAVMQRFKELHS